MSAQRPAGRAWAYLGVLLGGAVSIAANIAHSYVPPVGVGVDWSPHAGAVIGAVFWPLALFVAVEIFARTAWPSQGRWALLRWLGLLPVALVAAVVSYRHLSGLLAFYGEDVLTTRIGPLAVDGLMVMATGALIATSVRRSVAIVPASESAQVGPVVNVLPAEAMPDVSASANVAADVPDGPVPATTPAAVPVRKVAVRRKRKPTTADKVTRAAAKTPDATAAELARRLKVSESTVRRYRPPAEAVTS